MRTAAGGWRGLGEERKVVVCGGVQGAGEFRVGN